MHNINNFFFEKYEKNVLKVEENERKISKQINNSIYNRENSCLFVKIERKTNRERERKR